MSAPSLPREISLLRICAQGLVPATSHTSIRSAVSDLLAVQGQQVGSVPHALLSRCPLAVRSDVVQAFDSNALVRSRPMRGTVHVTAAEDYHWLRLTLNSVPTSAAKREEKRLQITDALAEAAAQVAWREIASHSGRLPRKELFSAWTSELNLSRLDTPAERRRACNALMWRLDREGAIIEAPLGRSGHDFIDANTLPAADSEQSGFPMTADDVDRGLVEVARRYARGHGPVTVADLARWTGLPKTTAFRAIEGAVEASADSADKPGGLADSPADSADNPVGSVGNSVGSASRPAGIKRYRIEGSALLAAAKPRNLKEASGVLYMREDLPDLLADNRRAARKVLFLASFDELHVGYKDRTCLTDEAGERLVCPAKNGMFFPLLVSKGALVAVKPVNQELRWLGDPAPSLRDQVESAIAKMGKRLGCDGPRS